MATSSGSGAPAAAIPPTGTFCLPTATRVVVVERPSEVLLTGITQPPRFSALATIKLLAPDEARRIIISGLPGVGDILDRLEERLIERALRARGR